MVLSWRWSCRGFVDQVLSLLLSVLLAVPQFQKLRRLTVDPRLVWESCEVCRVFGIVYVSVVTDCCAPYALPPGLGLSVHTQVLACWRASSIYDLDLIPCHLCNVTQVDNV